MCEDCMLAYDRELHACICAHVCALVHVFQNGCDRAWGIPCEQHAAAVRAVIARSLSCYLYFFILLFVFVLFISF